MDAIGGPPALPLPAVDPEAGRVETLRRMAPGDARPAAARELEVTFLTQLLAAMRRAVPESDLLPRSEARNIYEGMFDRNVAEAMAARDPLGLLRQLQEEPR